MQRNAEAPPGRAVLRRRRVFYGLLRRVLPAAVLGTVIYLVITEKYVCIFYRLFGIPCAGCGMTHAYRALLRLDFRAAFEYHCLFPIPALWAGYELILRRFRRLPARVEGCLLVISAALFLLRWALILFT